MTTTFRKLAGVLAGAAMIATVFIPASQAATTASLPDIVKDCPRVINHGDKGNCVKALQSLLNKHGAKLGVDGDFGRGTWAAVYAFQYSKSHLSVDGQAGPNTKAALLAAPSNKPTPAPARGAEFRRNLIEQAKAFVGSSHANRPYAWGGGHGAKPGPSFGTCAGYTGSIKPCPADKTWGLDCSGFSRYMIYLAGGGDIGGGSTDDQWKKGTIVSSPVPGDLVFFGTKKDTHHVGIYAGGGKMYEEPRTGLSGRLGDVSERGKHFYVRYNG